MCQRQVKTIILSLLFFMITAQTQASSQLPYTPGQIIVKIAQPTGLTAQSFFPMEEFAKHKGAVSFRKVSWNPFSKTVFGITPSSSVQHAKDSFYILTFDPHADLEKISRDLVEDKKIIFAEPNYHVYAFWEPNDPDYPKQNYLRHPLLKEIWSLPVVEEVLIGVVDSGVDINHEDIRDSIFINYHEIENGIDDDHNGFIDDRIGFNFNGFSSEKSNPYVHDDYGHGTHIAGIIAAKTHNAIGIAGINPRAKILPVRFLNNEGYGTQLDAAMAIRYAADMGAKIINCSWGYYKSTRTLEEAIQYAQQKGVIIVAAAGNSGYTGFELIEYPAGFKDVIAVGSVDNTLNPSYFSSYGPHVTFSFFGERIYSLLPQNLYGIKSGTSQSAALFSGIISRILSFNPSLSSKQIAEILKRASQPLGKADWNPYTGYGIPSITALLSLIQSSNFGNEDVSLVKQQQKAALTEVLNFPNPFGNEGTRFGFRSNQNGQFKIYIFQPNGQRARLLEGLAFADYNTVFWDGRDEQGNMLSNGTYFYIVELKTESETIPVRGKCAVLK